MGYGKQVKYLTPVLVIFVFAIIYFASNCLLTDSSSRVPPAFYQDTEKRTRGDGVFSKGEVFRGYNAQQSTHFVPKIVWLAERPTGDIIFASCDGNYFREHAASFVSSANIAGNNVHVHVVNPKEYTKAQISDISGLKVNISVTFSLEYTSLASLEEKTYFASNRFMTGSQLLEEATRVMIVDIDCLLMSHIEFPENKDLGLFLRESAPGTSGWVALGTKVAAGMVFVTRDSKDFLLGVQRRILEHGLVWYVDQVALYEQFIDGGWDRNPRFFNFNNGHLDWEFTEGSKIWTGKGDRKNSNEVYVEKKKYFAQRLG